MRVRLNPISSPEGSVPLHIQAAAHFTVRKRDQVLYETTKDVERDWDSSFFGPIAIPAAANNYNPMLQDLLKTLYSDPQFVQALK